MGTGFYNSKSLITVRLLTHRQEEITDELIASRVKAACDYRRFVMNRPGTDSCRLIYGEADRLPGVIADRFGGVIVLQVLALGMERFTQTIADALLACEKPDCLLLQNDDAIRRKEGMECFTRVLYGTLPEENIIHENGVKLAVDVPLAVRRRAISSTRRIITCLCASSARTRACWIASPTSARSRSTRRPPERKK